MLEEKENAGMQAWVRELLKLYRKYPALYEIDDDWAGFEWMNANDGENSVYSFVRRSSRKTNSLLFVLNMTPVKREGYRVPVPAVSARKKYRLLLNSDEERFGGWGNETAQSAQAEEVFCSGHEYSISVDLPPYGALVYLFQG